MNRKISTNQTIFRKCRNERKTRKNTHSPVENATYGHGLYYGRINLY